MYMNDNQYIAHCGIIIHYGVGADNNPPGRGSGRYPKGSGKRPFQHDSAMRNTTPNNYGMGILTYVLVTTVLPSVAVTSLTYATAGVAMAVQKGIEKRRHKKKHAGQELDKSTGFYLKPKGKTYTDEEDMAAVNPALRDDNNTKRYEASNNCMLCSMAYELRQRGYDVEAKLDASLGNISNFKKWYPGAEPKFTKYKSKTLYYSDHNMADPADKKELKAYRAAAMKELSKLPNNSRGTLMINWEKDGRHVGGHAVAYKVERGKLKIIDAQVGRIYTGKDIQDLINKTCRVGYVRLDNLDFDKKKIREVAI